MVEAAVGIHPDASKCDSPCAHKERIRKRKQRVHRIGRRSPVPPIEIEAEPLRFFILFQHMREVPEVALSRHPFYTQEHRQILRAPGILGITLEHSHQLLRLLLPAPVTPKQRSAIQDLRLNQTAREPQAY